MIRNASKASKRAKAPDSTGDTADAGTGAITSVPGSATSVPLLAANAARQGFMIYNDSDAILYLALADTTASTTNFSALVLPHTPFVPGGTWIYTGVITGAWDSATGAARVTEFS